MKPWTSLCADILDKTWEVLQYRSCEGLTSITDSLALFLSQSVVRSIYRLWQVQARSSVQDLVSGSLFDVLTFRKRPSEFSASDWIIWVRRSPGSSDNLSLITKLAENHVSRSQTAYQEALLLSCSQHDSSGYYKPESNPTIIQAA